MLNFFKSLYKKLYLFLLAPIENWLFTIKKDNGMYYFRYVCYRFVHYCLYLVCWYIFLSHIDYFYHFRVYQVFWLGHLLYWAYPYNNWDCEKFGPGWEFSGTLWDENALGDDGVVLEVFGDRILDYVWFLFIIWNIFYLLGFIFINYGLYFSKVRGPFIWTAFVGLSLYIPKDVILHYYNYLWTPGFTFFLLPWLSLSVSNFIWDAIADDDEDIDYWAASNEMNPDTFELDLVMGGSYSLWFVFDTFLSFWYWLYKILDIDWWRAGPVERKFYLRFNEMLVNVKGGDRKSYSFHKYEAWLKRKAVKSFISALIFEDLNYQIDRMKRQWKFADSMNMFKDEKGELREIWEDTSKHPFHERKARNRHKYMLWRKHLDIPANTYIAVLEDTTDRLETNTVTFDEILYLYEHRKQKWAFEDINAYNRYFWARRKLAVYTIYTTNTDIESQEEVDIREIFADLSVEREYIYQCFLGGKYIESNLFASAQDISWLNTRWWFYDFVGNLWVAWEWILILLYDPVWKSVAFDNFFRLPKELPDDPKYVEQYMNSFYKPTKRLNKWKRRLDIQRRFHKIVTNIFVKKQFFFAGKYKRNSFHLKKVMLLAKLDHYVDYLFKLEKDGRFKAKVRYNWEDLYYFKKGVAKQARIDIEHYNKTIDITSRFYLASNRKGFFLDLRLKIEDAVNNEFKIFVEDIKKTFLPVTSFIKQIKTINYVKLYYIIKSNLTNLWELELIYFTIWIVKWLFDFAIKFINFWKKMGVLYKDIVLLTVKYTVYKPIKWILEITWAFSRVTCITLFQLTIFFYISILKLSRSIFMMFINRYLPYNKASMFTSSKIPSTNILSRLFYSITNINNYKYTNIKKNIKFFFDLITIKFKLYIYKFTDREQSFHIWAHQQNFWWVIFDISLWVKISLTLIKKPIKMIEKIYKYVKMIYLWRKISNELLLSGKNRRKFTKIRYKWFIPLYKRRRPSKSPYNFKVLYGTNPILRWIIFKLFIIRKKKTKEELEDELIARTEGVLDAKGVRLAKLRKERARKKYNKREWWKQLAWEFAKEMVEYKEPPFKNKKK